jgi:dCMP deaminase
MSILSLLQNLQNNIENRPSWKEYFMSTALLTSTRSPCNRLKVGCVIVKDNHIVSSGYNGFISGFKHESIVRDEHEQMTVHAEQNAICDVAKRGVSIDNSIIYITHYPCINCFKIIISSGIKHIYYLNDYKNDELVEKLIKEYNIECEKINI